jgi:DNA helicase-2/ATP-dependent DNA helicase PcrA
MAVGDLAVGQAFQRAAREQSLTVADVAAGLLRAGKITLTTYHSAKGREWDVVIMPGLVDGLMPKRFWSKQLRRFGQPVQLAQDRRAFYVGITRAADIAVLIYGQYWETDWGYQNRLGPSRFVHDILGSMDKPPASDRPA